MKTIPNTKVQACQEGLRELVDLPYPIHHERIEFRVYPKPTPNSFEVRITVESRTLRFMHILAYKDDPNWPEDHMFLYRRNFDTRTWNWLLKQKQMHVEVWYW